MALENADERAREGVRDWIRNSGRRTRERLRAAGPYAILAFLTASVVAPVAGAGLGAPDAFAAALDQVGGLGTNYLADTLAGTARRLREEEPESGGWSEAQWRDAIAADLLPRLAAADEQGRALHEEVSRVLREVGAVTVAIAEAAVTDDELRRVFEGAFQELGFGVAELGWMVTDVRQSVDGLRQDFARQTFELTRRLDEVRRHLVEVTREQLPPGDDPPAVVPGGAVPPYPGLVSFQPEDASRFRGREQQIAQLLSRIAEQALGGPPLVVTGVSGAGKSSLLRAGLLPAIAGGALGEEATGWSWVVTTPGVRPLTDLLSRLRGSAPPGPPPSRNAGLGELAAKATAAGHRPIIVVDQFEELFTQCADQAERLAYVTALTSAAPAIVVIAVRSDFYPSCVALPPLAKVLAAGHVVLGPLDAAAIRRAVVEPAEHVGLTVEPGLPGLLLRDLGVDDRGGYEPGALPLLAHALRATWDRREGIRLTVKAYQDTGGIRHAVAETAENIYLDQTPEDRARLRDALLALVTVTADGTAVRRRGVRAASDSRVLRRLVKARLVTVGADTVEISHEALLTSWPRLAGWVAEAREDLLLRESVTEAARDWDRSGRDPDLLPRGARLIAARERIPAGDGVPPVVGEYLAAGGAAALREQLARERGTRRLRRLAAGLGVALLLTAGAGLVALDRQRTAEAVGRDARSRQYAAEALTLLDQDEPAAVRRALDAWSEEPTAEAEGALLSTQQVRFAGRLGTVDGGYSAAVSPDGTRIAIGDKTGLVRLWDAATLTEVGPPLAYTDTDADEVWVSSVAFSPDGRYLATGAIVADGVKIWEVATGALVRTLPAFGAVTWLPGTGTVVATDVQLSGKQAVLGFWEASTGRSLRTLPVGEDSGKAVAVSPDGAHLAEVGLHAAEVWRLRDGRRLASMAMASPAHLAFAPDGSLVTGDPVAGNRSQLRQWDPATGRKLRDITPADGLTAPNAYFAITGDGMVIGSRGEGRVNLWPLSGNIPGDLRIGTMTYAAAAASASGQFVVVTGPDEPTVVFRRVVNAFNTEGEVYDVHFSPDGRRIAAGGFDGTVRIWDAATRTRITSFRPAGSVIGLAWTSGGLIGVVTRAETLELWDERGERQVSVKLPSCPKDMTVSPRGDLMYVSTSSCVDGALLTTPAEIHVYDVGGRRMRNKIDLDGDSSYAIALTPDGGTLYAALTTSSLESGAAGVSAELRSWRAGDLAEIGEPRPLGGYQVLDLAIAPDGRSMAVTGTSRSVDVRSADGATSLWHSPEQGDQIDRVSWSPDGRTLAIGDRQGPVRLWDMTTRRNPVALHGHVSTPAALEFAPDGRTLVSGGLDSQVYVWQLDPSAAAHSLCGIAASLTRNDGQPLAPACS
ncbi:AAA family ATPase [Actinoplanes couchii]|uniref:nSTAND1 domain-containing NTPase n=1 Tax=Actinoplanes couchii TaxID=403638 RepID=UPI00194080D0|nr:AAA family ATPase [Actinoplanes couchii]MDR6325920.1 WD40 repeat protein [Actinoplanes couchii]